MLSFEVAPAASEACDPYPTWTSFWNHLMLKIPEGSVPRFRRGAEVHIEDREVRRPGTLHVDRPLERVVRLVRLDNVAVHVGVVAEAIGAGGRGRPEEADVIVRGGLRLGGRGGGGLRGRL